MIGYMCWMVTILFSKNNGSQILLNKSKVYLPWGFPCGSAGKECACNAGILSWEDPLEKGKATHSGILAWKILWTV